DTSGITAFALVAVCAGIGAAFILALAVAFICKAVNRPTEEAMPYLIHGHGALYQPSAAGYGAGAGASGSGADGKKGGASGGKGGGGGGKANLGRTPSVASQSRANLLNSAQPMGQDDSFSHQHHGNGNGNSSVNDLSRTHTRGTSSSISQHPFPATPLAARRPGFGPGGGHPTLNGESIAPDGSGFTPGQVFPRSPMGSVGPAGPGSSSFSNPNGLGGGGAARASAFLSVKPSMDSGGRPSMQHSYSSGSTNNNNRMSMISMARGPPPATAESRRRSRYSRIGGPDGGGMGHLGGGGGGGSTGPGGIGSGGEPPMPGSRGANRVSRKIDSVGPGVLRKSMFLTGDAQFPGVEALQRTGSRNTQQGGGVVLGPGPAGGSGGAGGGGRSPIG
ncbi:hypothetical protein V8E36_004329, partial [Tilletia maclaganii]